MSDHALSQAEIDALLSEQGKQTPPTSSEQHDLPAIDDLFETIVHPLGAMIQDLVGDDPDVEIQPTSIWMADQALSALQGRTVFSAQLHGAVQGPIIFAFMHQQLGQWVHMLGDISQGVDGSTRGGPHEMSESFESGQGHLADALTRCAAEALTSVVSASVQGTFDGFQQVNDDEGRKRFLSTVDHDVVYERTLTLTIADQKVDLSILISKALATQVLGHLKRLVQDDSEASPTHVPALSVPTQQEEATNQGMSQAVKQSTLRDQGNIDLLLDVQLQVTVELGRTRMPIKELLALGTGSVIELDKLAGEPVEVYVNGKLLARGEVVTIDDHFGVKITDIVQKVDRVKSLR